MLSARESRGELRREGPGARKDARGGSRGPSKGGLSTTGKEGGKEGAGVAYSVTAVESGRSSVMTGGKKEVDVRKKKAQGSRGVGGVTYSAL